MKTMTGIIQVVRKETEATKLDAVLGILLSQR